MPNVKPNYSKADYFFIEKRRATFDHAARIVWREVITAILALRSWEYEILPKWQMIKRMLWLAGAICALVFCLVCYSVATAGVRVVISNADATLMQNVTVQTSGGVYSLGDIAPHSSKMVRVDGGDGSDIQLNYADAGKVRRVETVDCYFESGFRGSIEIEVKSGKIAQVKNNIRLGLF